MESYGEGSKIDRRTLLRLAVNGAISFSSLNALACSTPKQLPIVEQQAPIVPIAPERIARIEDALNNTNDPLIRFCATRLNSLRTSLVKPLEFPGIVSDDSFPLLIRIQDSNASEASSHAAINIKQIDQNFPYKLMLVTPNGSKAVPVINSVGLNLLLATTSYLRRDGSLFEGMFLSKELLTMLFMVQFGEDSYRYLGRNISIKDGFNNEVRDPQIQKAAGWSIMLDQAIITSSQVHKTIDLLPIYFLGSRIIPLVSAGKLPAESQSITPMYKAAMILNNNQEFKNAVSKYVEDWLSSSNLLPPAGAAEVFSEPRFNSIIQQNRLY